MGSLMMKLLLLILIIGGSVSCSLGVEPLESLVSQKGRKEKTACQLAVKENSSDMIEKLRENDENPQAAADSKQNIDGNFRHNEIIMRRLLQRGPVPPSSGNTPCTHIPGRGKGCVTPNTHG
ncbi:uncharacterized protein LOC131182477 [Hevea brasiliensis]|uniref:uncharacterized protein LOC131182477 n=1 Tax=Hevea brasiliensis TaxID=3981 RepID=UPI0025E065C7|nr:uncharacterized protein LOC131182477 [Hevea brasiliensis]